MRFSPPLTLVGPGMTHWDESGGSPWLDQFLANLTADERGRIRYLAQHDYSGNAQAIVARANAAQKKYGRQVWITEFAVGSSAERSKNDAFIREAAPLFDTTDSIARYAWFSARNTGSPTSWVYQSNLLEPLNVSHWTEKGNSACESMEWLSQHKSASECQSETLQNTKCATPKIAVYESGDVQNCYCSSSSSCVIKTSSWQNMFVHSGTIPANWSFQPNTVCHPSEMEWIGQHESVDDCKNQAVSTLSCVIPKSVMWEPGPTHNCYCQNSSTCTRNSSTWLSMYTQPPPPTIVPSLTSTGKLYVAND